LATRSSKEFRQSGERVANALHLDDDVFDNAERAARALETQPDATLDELLAPSAAAVGRLFAHTAQVANRPENEASLYRAGCAFGRLVHLADAIEDIDGDIAAGRFNPLAATRTAAEDAYRLAQSLAVEIRAALSEVDMADPSLANALFGPVLTSAVQRLQPVQPRASASAAAATVGIAALTTTILGVFGGGRWGRRGYPPYDPGYGYGYGRGYRRGPSCCDVLACDCCISEGCSAATGEDCCCCCV
jgi:hypothetical protein